MLLTLEVALLVAGLRLEDSSELLVNLHHLVVVPDALVVRVGVLVVVLILVDSHARGLEGLSDTLAELGVDSGVVLVIRVRLDLGVRSSILSVLSGLVGILLGLGGGTRLRELLESQQIGH
jgi:hypothetical protein